MKKKLIIILIVAGIILLSTGLLLKNKNVFSKNKIEVLDTTYICSEAIEDFYEDDEYIYSFPCIKSSYVYVKFKDNTKKLVVDALNEKLVTIKELEKAGLEFSKREK